MLIQDKYGSCCSVIECKWGISQGGIAQDFTTVVAGIGAKTQSKINFDNTADVLNATIGNELFLTVSDFNLYWTHYYVYVDYNQNGVFESNEVVSYITL